MYVSVGNMQYLQTERTCQKDECQTKATGIVRKVDELGRIVLPIELRRTLEINEKDDLEIYVEGASIILRKYRPTCVFCNGAKNIITYKGKNICPRCLKGIKNLEIT